MTMDALVTINANNLEIKIVKNCRKKQISKSFVYDNQIGFVLFFIKNAFNYANFPP